MVRMVLPVQQAQPVQQLGTPSPDVDSATAYAMAVGYEPPVPPAPRKPRGALWLALAIGFLGILAAIAAVVYYTVPAHSLPSFLGPVAHAKAHVHRIQRGQAAAVAAVALLIIAVVIGLVAGRSGRSGRREQHAD